MAKYSVLMTDTIFPDTVIEQEELGAGDAELTLSPGSGADALLAEGADCDAMLVVYAPVGADVIERLTRCKVIVRAGIGFNNVDLDAASRAGIMVANVPDYCLDEVADHTMALYLASVRKVCLLHAEVQAGTWSAVAAKPVPRLRGKVFGLLGCGAIGQQVARRAAAFGMEVVGHDPYAPDEALAAAGIRRITDFDEFLATVDALSLHVPLTDTTRHIIARSSLERMKPTAHIVNTSRGGLIHEGDLHEALSGGVIAGAALDVLETEPPAAAPALAALRNVIITPHAAFFSEESVAELRRKASREIIRTLRDGRPKFCVNPE